MTQPALTAVPGNSVITIEDLLRSPAVQLRMTAGKFANLPACRVSDLEDPTLSSIQDDHDYRHGYSAQRPASVRLC
jgi:hypothetical protein